MGTFQQSTTWGAAAPPQTCELSANLAKPLAKRPPTFLCSNQSPNQYRSAMARGHQKIQSQQKAQEKAAKLKKQQGHSAADQKKAANAALKIACTVCKSAMPDPKTYKQHFENKHPKAPLPEELKAI